MKSEDQLTVLAHTQVVARHFLALRCSGEKIVELIRHSIGTQAPEPEQINNLLRREKIQKQLEAEYETAIWQSTDANKTWRLICLATPTSPADAAARLNKRPPDANCCSWCWQSEPGYQKETLIPEIDIHGRETGARLHPQCQRPWNTLSRLVERATISEKN